MPKLCFGLPQSIEIYIFRAGPIPEFGCPVPLFHFLSAQTEEIMHTKDNVAARSQKNDHRSGDTFKVSLSGGLQFWPPGK